LLMSVVLMPIGMIDDERCSHWPGLFERLALSGRAQVRQSNETYWAASECVDFVDALKSGTPCEVHEDAVRKCVQGWIQILGPVTANG